VSQIEGCGGLIRRHQGLGCPGVKTAEAGTAAVAAGGGALYFFFYSIQMTVGASPIQMKNNSYFSF
jgi:hypothetical protein